MMRHNVEQFGYKHVQIVGDAGNDIADVCRLTCLEQGIKIVSLAGSELPPTHYFPPTISHTPRTTNHEPRTTNPMNPTNSMNPCPVESYSYGATNSTIPVLHIDGRELSLEWLEGDE